MSTDLIKQLRSETGAGIMDVRKALQETNNDPAAALEWLRKKGAASAAKKADRTAGEGVIASYIHLNRIGVLVELNCETDFVARNEEFQQLATDLAMQVASMSPLYVSPEQISADVIAKERDIYREQMANESKPADVIDKIIDGKINKWQEEVCLLNQPFFKNPDQTVSEVLTAAVGKMGEKMQIRRFVRFALDDADSVKDLIR